MVYTHPLSAFGGASDLSTCLAYLPIGLAKPNLTANEAYDILFPTRGFIFHKSNSRFKEEGDDDEGSVMSGGDTGVEDEIKKAWDYKRNSFEYMWWMSRAYHELREEMQREGVPREELRGGLKRELFEYDRGR